MIHFILAAGLGLQFIVVVLLFRRLRQNLNRQLRDMRAERNSEQILRALQGAPEAQHQAVWAANGIHPEPALSGVAHPVRRKKHLGLYLGGGLAAMTVTVSQAMRETWKSHPLHLAGTVVGMAAVTTVTMVLLTYQPWQDGDQRPPSSAPTAAPSFIPPPTGTRTPSPSPSQETGASPSPSPSSTVPASSALPMSESTEADPSAETDPSGKHTPTTPGPQPPDHPPASGTAPGPSPSGDDAPPPPNTTPSPSPPAEPEPTQDSSGPCVGLTVMPVVSAVTCLLGGG